MVVETTLVKNTTYDGSNFRSSTIDLAALGAALEKILPVKWRIAYALTKEFGL